MSYEEFRKRIDTARQILVGAVPSPAGQIDQITYALMYKFMNDIDDQSAALGGKRTYFVDDYARYNWHELMKPGLEAHDQLELYRQAIQGMNKNPGLPPLFREIYQNAFLPFNSPSVLRLFLNEINKFNHGDSDDIGDAYEYLLSITGAQGDVGQFRTPRHIIKFIVEAVNPTKDDSVLDPAVGTAGFLIAAYNHVKSQHDGKDNQGNANDEKRLTADELEKLHHNYRGFDIDPTMVRTASVNLYLHGFTSPDIRNHDSLSSEDYWNDRYDVVLANPPFMSPKGGIQPHKKFSISANRAEVLFVDYIASHLKPNGRAGVVVPEGIIFQSGKVYKELRKNLVENYVYAVVSLPAGVFQPYSGVKTSVLLMDKQLAKERDDILFVKIENDGYTLGSQRRRDVLNDQLPQALDYIKLYQKNHHQDTPYSHTVSRKEIGKSGDYNLSGDRYKVSSRMLSSVYPHVKLGDVVELIGGGTPSRSKDEYWRGDIKWITSKYVSNDHGISGFETITSLGLKNSSSKIAPVGSVIMITRVSVGKYAYTDQEYAINQDLTALYSKDTAILDNRYLFHISLYLAEKVKKSAVGIGVTGVTRDFVANLEIPLPPIQVQREIVAELDGYKKIIDSAREMYQANGLHLAIKSSWPQKQLDEIATLEYGKALPSRDRREGEYPVMGSNGVSGYHDTFSVEGPGIVVGRKGSAGEVTWIESNFYPIDTTYYVKLKSNELRLKFLYIQLRGLDLSSLRNGAGVPGINREDIYRNIKIAVPSIEEQDELVAEYEKTKRMLVDQNLEIIEFFEQKIKFKLSEIWGE